MSLKKYLTYQPNLDELVNLFDDKLKAYFENVQVEKVDCPDLAKSPFNLATNGLSSSCTSNKILDVGGESFLLPSVRLDKSPYDMVKIAKDSGFINRAHILGAACGPYKTIGFNNELIPNVFYTNDHLVNKTKCVYLSKHESGSNSKYVVKNSPNTNFQLLGNFYVSEGLEGKVLKIRAKRRRNEDISEISLNGNLISVMRKILNEHYKAETPVSMGGVFLLRSGKARLHIMPEFSKIPLENAKKVNDWLKFFDFDSPLLCFSVFHTHNNYNLYLREEHTHCFGIENNVAGGHYHYELDAKTVDYEGYFNVAGEIIRVDQP